jgi:hypothetical protein
VSNSGFTLRTDPGASGRATITGNVTLPDAADGVTLRGLNITGGSGFTTVSINGDNVTLLDVDVNGNGARNCILAGAGGDGNNSQWAMDFAVQKSRIHDCGDNNHEHAIYAEFTERLRVTVSYLYANGGYGLHFYPNAQNSLVEYTVVDDNAKATGWSSNVTFSGEAAGGEYSQPYGSRNNIVRYSLITNAVQNYNVESYFPPGSLDPVGNEIAYSCVFNAPKGNFDGSDGFSQHDNKALDPKYVDRSNRDYHLKPDTPCTGWGPH